MNNLEQGKRQEMWMKFEHYHLEDGAKISVQKGDVLKGEFMNVIIEKENNKAIRQRFDCILTKDALIKEVRNLQADNE